MITLPFHKGVLKKKKKCPLSTSVRVKSNINISSSRPTWRVPSRWSEGTQLAVKSIAKSIIHSQTKLAASRLMNWWTHPELPTGSWRWWRWRSRSWPGCCHQSCCQFLPCRIRRGCKPLPASARFHRGCLQRICEGRLKKKEKKNTTHLFSQGIVTTAATCASSFKCDCTKAIITMATTIIEAKAWHRLPKFYIWNLIFIFQDFATKSYKSHWKRPRSELEDIIKACNIMSM